MLKYLSFNLVEQWVISLWIHNQIVLKDVHISTIYEGTF